MFLFIPMDMKLFVLFLKVDASKFLDDSVLAKLEFLYEIEMGRIFSHYYKNRLS